MQVSSRAALRPRQINNLTWMVPSHFQVFQKVGTLFNHEIFIFINPGGMGCDIPDNPALRQSTSKR